MPAYLIVDVRVHEPKRYEHYKEMVPPTLANYGGRFVVRGGAPETLEGEWAPDRLVVIEFPSREHARQWWSSVEYAPALKLRQETARTDMILVEGI